MRVRLKWDRYQEDGRIRLLRLFLPLFLVTGCCVLLCGFEELEMQMCISGLVLLVRIAHQHSWLLRSCACIYHAVIMLSSHLTANQNKGVTCTHPGNQSGDRMIELTNHSVTCKNVFILRPPPQSYLAN